MKLFKFAALGVFIVLPACDDMFGASALEFTVEGDAIVARGEIDGGAQRAFEVIADENPDIRLLVLDYIEGSVDDDANLEFGRLVRQMGFSTLVPSDGMIASGGTDLFLAGVERIVEPGACIGVHSWATDDYTATDVARNSEEHDPYIDYFADIGVDPEFYWFTIDAAPADDMHWMSVAETGRFDMTSNSLNALSSDAVCDAR